ncbi:MAG: Steroid C27-monooxygenase [Modestobacter sp.]|jgi:cholest-4-en-3-one 26-monooxygenase|nr:Steroid C27-monooxygenase [Modestobacter sp.]MCW2578298.1 Steroid C27-monooxygenase [Modestobacter sp.]MCW2620344.1 Steroid C27-monooxygenase [Modestobacter sp.]
MDALSDVVDLSEERFGQGVPFDTFAKLRSTAPIWWSERDQCWVVTSYDLVEEVNRDFTTFSSAGGPIPPDDPGHPELPIMLADDPPVHTMYRRLVSRNWTPRAALTQTSLVADTVAEVVDAFVKKGGGDFVDEVAAPIPFRIIAAIVGIPAADAPALGAWTNALMPSKDPEYRRDPDAPLKANRALDAYFGDLLEDHRTSPREDLCGALLGLRKADGEPLDERELRDFLALFITGGSETTRHLLSHTILALTEAPGERKRLVEGDVDAATAVEEMLRWSTPVLHHSRWATADVEVGGQLVRKGQRLTLWMISANHDESVFEDPLRLDLGRRPNPHISFGGGGPHFCLGAHVARLEAVQTFERLRPILGSIELVGPPERIWTNFLNGIKRMPVTLS